MRWDKYKNIIIELLNNTDFNSKILDILIKSKTSNQKIFIAGNGGSAATAAHYGCDLSLGASKINYLENVDRYNVMPLSTNIPLILAIANDYGYEEIFKQQLVNLAKPDDILLVISGSGNSKNIVKAVEYANEIKMTTVGFCGFDGGKLKQITDYSVHVKSDLMEACEDIHSIIGHFIALWLREN